MHEEHEEVDLSDDLEIINVNQNTNTFIQTDNIEVDNGENSRRQSTSIRGNNNSNHFPPPPLFSPLVHRYNLHNAIVKLPHELELLSNLSPISNFMLFFTSEIFNQLVENSNSYAIKKSAGTGRDWYLLSVPGLKIWMALLIYMGLFKFPSVDDYWNLNDRSPKHKITQYMSLYRFEQVKLPQMYV
nr:11141_t:CDS:2 [Entrophospora candida]